MQQHLGGLYLVLKIEVYFCSSNLESLESSFYFALHLYKRSCYTYILSTCYTYDICVILQCIDLYSFIVSINISNVFLRVVQEFTFAVQW